MVTSSNREKMLKHYMHTNDFELDHHRDITDVYKRQVFLQTRNPAQIQIAAFYRFP